MKIVGSVKENLGTEKRIAITPDTAKKLLDLNLSIFLEKNYGEHLGISDEEYRKVGVSFLNTSKEVLEKSEIILKVNDISNDEIAEIKEKTILIGQFDPFSNKETLNKCIKKNIKIFSLILLPRITRAQSMDVLSSQANLAGYRAVIEAVKEFGLGNKDGLRCRNMWTLGLILWLFTKEIPSAAEPKLISISQFLSASI